MAETITVTAANKIKQLKEQIAKYNYHYYQKDSPLVSDAEFDKTMAELRALEEKYPQLITKDSPSQKVAGEVSEQFSKKKHSFPMLSLSNAFNNDDIFNFIKRLQRFLNETEDFFPEFSAEPKIDGLSLALRYEHGKLKLALTRGDGIFGEDVTINALTIDNIPKTINTKLEVLEVRGEVFINKNDFFKLNEEQQKNNQKVFANPRNAAAGSLRQLNPEVTKQRPLKFMVWGFGEISGNIGNNLSEVFTTLTNLGFSVNPLNTTCSNINELFNYYNKITNIRHKIAYDIDGVVFKVNNLSLQERLGVVAKDPRWAIAYKFPAQEAVTKLNKIIISVGRTGALTPVAVLDPINIGGAVVTKASLHNEDEIKRKDIREGDTVVIKRAGDVIPQVVEVINKDSRSALSKPFVMPEFCPICGSPALREEDKAVRRCTGRFICKAMIVQSLIHFVAKDAFDINGLGEKQIELFYELGFIKTPYDIFFLKNHESKIIALEGFGEKSFNNLKDAIENAKNISLERFIYALGIPTVGIKTAQILAKKYLNINNFIKEIQKAKCDEKTSQELINIDSIGLVTAEEIVGFFSNKANVIVVSDLLTAVTVQDYLKEEINKDNPFYGKTVVFTGTLTKFSRAEAKYLVEKMGASVSGSVSAKTSFLITGENPGSKLKQAKELNVQVIDENEFNKLL